MLLERFYFYNFSLGLGFSGRSGSGHAPSRALCPPDARLPRRQAAHPAQTKRNAPKHQHQRGNGYTRRQARHRRCPQTRQQRRSRS
jgi:hypothetical protein